MNETPGERTLASLNTIVSSYFDFARQTADQLRHPTPVSDVQLQVAVALIMLVGAVEAYLNIAGRMWIEQVPGFAHAEQIRQDLAQRRSFMRKLKTWPELLFGKPLDLSAGKMQAFLGLVERRNSLLHFTTTHESAGYDNVRIHGLADISFYASLKPEDLFAAIDTAEDAIGELIRQQGGLNEERVLMAKTYWSGRPVFPDELERARKLDSGSDAA